MQRRGGGDSFLRDCTVAGNEVGVRLRDEGKLFVRSTRFERNEVHVRALSPRTTLVMRGSSLRGRPPIELHPGRAFDLRENWWGAPTPNLARRVRYSENAKSGDALLEPSLDEEPHAGAHGADD